MSFVLNDLCVVGLAAFCIIAAVLRRSLLIDSVAFFAMGFAAVGFGSAVAAVPRLGLSPLEFLVGVSYLVRWLTYFGVYLFIVNNIRPAQVTGIWRSLLIVMLVFTAFGIIQSIFLPNFAQLVYPTPGELGDWDAQGHRLVSFVLEPNIAAAMITLVLLIQLAQISVGVRVPWWQPILFLVGLALTLSRSGVLALIVGLGVILVARGLSLRLIRLFGVVLFLSIALIPRLISFAQTYARFDVGSRSSAGARVVSWILELQMIADHPIAGIGFNTFGFVKDRAGMVVSGQGGYGSDGGLLFAAVMTGLVGLALYVGMLSLVIRRCKRIWRDPSADPEHRGLAIGTAAGVVAICVHSLFGNSIFTTFVMEILWVSWGLIFVIARELRGRATAEA